MPDINIIKYFKVANYNELLAVKSINIHHLLDIINYTELLDFSRVLYINNIRLFEELVIDAFLRYINLYSIVSVRNGKCVELSYKSWISENNKRFLSCVLNQHNINEILNNSIKKNNFTDIYKLLKNSCIFIHQNNKEIYKTLTYLIIVIKVFLSVEILGKK